MNQFCKKIVRGELLFAGANDNLCDSLNESGKITLRKDDIDLYLEELK